MVESILCAMAIGAVLHLAGDTVGNGVFDLLDLAGVALGTGAFRLIEGHYMDNAGGSGVRTVVAW